MNLLNRLVRGYQQLDHEAGPVVPRGAPTAQLLAAIKRGLEGNQAKLSRETRLLVESGVLLHEAAELARCRQLGQAALTALAAGATAAGELTAGTLEGAKERLDVAVWKGLEVLARS